MMKVYLRSINMASRADEKKTRSKRAYNILMILTDIGLIGVGLVIYALFHHALPKADNTIPITLPQATLETRSVIDDVALDDQQTQEEANKLVNSNVSDPESKEVTPKDENILNNAFSDKFTSGEIISNENSYISKNINILINTIQKKRNYISHRRYIYS